MEVLAQGKFLKITPRKLRLVADMVKGLKVEKALNLLTVTKKRGTYFVSQVLKSAIANGENTHKLASEDLYIKEIFVDSGPFHSKGLPRSMGRVNMVKKRSSHLMIKLGQKLSK